MIDDSLLPFSLPSVDRKKITAAFDGGRISSDGGAMLLDRRSGASGSPTGLLRRSPIGATRHGLFMRFLTSCALASWQLLAATKMPMTSIICVAIRSQAGLRSPA
jgi:hypothetical protein